MNNYTAIEPDIVSPDGSGPSGAQTQTPNQAGSYALNPNEWTLAKRLKESSHPVALLFYIFFRLSSIFVYIFGGLFIGMITKNSRFILHFIIIILLISADFWNLKNIAGRLLVGLRWWNETNMVESNKSDFENVWIFETADPNRYINPIDSKVFWSLLYIQPLLWVVLGIVAILKFEFLYLLLIIIAITLSITNAMAFTKCDKFGKANNIATDFLWRNTGSLFSKLNPFSN
ncbi:uncharacterized protein PRCAT00000103001 [Priceomyces carsonii]|uniref:uncharacterized protein n=1 Tax=Priceomyces carsonii TaxID=28549 RepID=UPI002ED85D71|nr:unnamed protein product [Priceomyces carsonii]